MNEAEKESLFGQLMAMASSFRKSQLLTTAVHFDLFNRFQNGFKSIQAVKKSNEDLEGLTRLCNALVSFELLDKKKKQFKNTTTADLFLTDSAEHDLRPMLRLQHRSYKVWASLDKAIEEGQSIDLRVDQENKQKWSPDFIAAMEARAHFSKKGVVEGIKQHFQEGTFLDLGGGSGVYAREILHQIPNAKGVLGDLPQVIDTARPYARQSKVADRLTLKEINMVEDESYGKGFSMILLSAIIHIFGPEENQSILKKAYNALQPGGQLIIIDYIMNKDKTAPQNGTLFGLHMFLATETGNVYSQEEIADWCRSTGFKAPQRILLDESADLLIADKKE